MTDVTEYRRALVLSGGAARAAYEAGVAAALVRRERFDVVCGTSMGAINGALIAQGLEAQLASRWHALANRTVLAPHADLAPLRTFVEHVRDVGRGPLHRRALAAGRVIAGLRSIPSPKRLLRVTGLLSTSPILALLDDVLDFASIGRSLIVSATNLSHGTSTAFHAFVGADAPERQRTFVAHEPESETLTRANYRDALAASAALPIAFAPIRIRLADGSDAFFADGAVANNSPLRQAIDAGADHVTIVFLQHAALRRKPHVIQNLASVGFIVQDIVEQRILDLDLKATRAVNRLVECGEGLGKRFVNVRVIGPSYPLRLPALRFDDAAAIDRVFAQGYADGEATAAVTRRMGG